MIAETFRIKCIVTAFALGLALAPGVMAQDDVLDQLYDELLTADEDATLRIERQIMAEWGRSGSAAMDFLMRRGKDALADGMPDAALDHFSALVDHAPDFAEGYYQRATAFYLLDEIGPAMADLAEVLNRNPRHFEAMRGLAVMLEETGQASQALDLYQMILKIAPNSPQAREEAARLHQQLEGLAI
jgi:tetratricopeptide (TPR) repeat protein